MPYSGPGDDSLPSNVKELTEDERSQWVALFNRRFKECTDGGGEDCESSAFRLANGVVMSNMLCASAEVASTRREILGGKSFLVAPVVLIKEGILNGTGGPELVLASEFAVRFHTWNGRPFVVGHPKDADGGAISANHPEITAQRSIGRVFNVRLDGDSLKGEAWIDLSRVPMVDGADRVVSRLESGDRVEVSTGYFRDVDSTPGKRDGKPYQAVARNLRPDHLAALLDSKGACSWDDGCGAPRVNELDYHLNIAAPTAEQLADFEEFKAMAEKLKGGDPLQIRGDTQPRGNAAMTALRGLMDTVGNVFRGKKEVMMTNAETILEDGRLNLNEEEIAALPDDVTEKLVASLAALYPDPPADNEGDPTEPTEPGDTPDILAEITGLKAALAELGTTVEQFRTAFAGIQANEDAEKAKLVAEVAAMESAFTPDQLNAIEVQTLDALKRSLSPADYSARGGGPEFAGRGEALPMPDLWATEE